MLSCCTISKQLRGWQRQRTRLQENIICCVNIYLVKNSPSVHVSSWHRKLCLTFNNRNKLAALQMRADFLKKWVETSRTVLHATTLDELLINWKIIHGPECLMKPDSIPYSLWLRFDLLGSWLRFQAFTRPPQSMSPKRKSSVDLLIWTRNVPIPDNRKSKDSNWEEVRAAEIEIDTQQTIDRANKSKQSTRVLTLYVKQLRLLGLIVGCTQQHKFHRSLFQYKIRIDSYLSKHKAALQGK